MARRGAHVNVGGVLEFELLDEGTRFTHVEHGVFFDQFWADGSSRDDGTWACSRLWATTSRDAPPVRGPSGWRCAYAPPKRTNDHTACICRPAAALPVEMTDGGISNDVPPGPAGCSLHLGHSRPATPDIVDVCQVATRDVIRAWAAARTGYPKTLDGPGADLTIRPECSRFSGHAFRRRVR